VVGNLKDREEPNPTGNLQMATDGARADSLCRTLVSSLLALAARCRRVVRRARSGGGSHTTIWRWVQRYGAELEQRLRRHLKPTNKSWPVDETYIRVQSHWCYLYRAIDSTGATIDFLLSALRDAAVAKRLFPKAFSDPVHPQPRVINTDKARLYGSAIAEMKEEGTLRRRCRHRPVQYLNNILGQDHRAIKRRVKAKQNLREFRAAQRTIERYEAMHMIRKGQARWVSAAMFANRISSSISCLISRLETSPTRSSRDLLRHHFKVATLPSVMKIYTNRLPTHATTCYSCSVVRILT
jgi:transposase-like protein